MAARKKRALARTVCLRDPKSQEVVVLRPGEVPPAWAAKLIRNPDAWETGEQKPEETPAEAESTKSGGTDTASADEASKEEGDGSGESAGADPEGS